LGESEGWIELDWQHIKGSLELVLHGNALAKGRLEVQVTIVYEPLVVYGIVDLRNPHLLLVVILVWLCLSINAIDHSLVVHPKTVIQLNITVNLLDDIVLNENKAVYLDMNRKSIGIETCTYLFVDLDEYIVGWLFDGAFAVFFRHGIN
jgi:hypothetical protein